MKRNYNDPEYEVFRKKVLRRDYYRCKVCKAKKRLHVHHLDGWDWFIAGRYEVSNGITLCYDCHTMFHNIYGKGNNTIYQFDTFLIVYHGKCLADIMKKKR